MASARSWRARCTSRQFSSPPRRMSLNPFSYIRCGFRWLLGAICVRQFFEKCGAFLKGSFGIVGVGRRDRLEVLREVAGASHSCFAMLFEVFLRLFDAVHDRPRWVSR